MGVGKGYRQILLGKGEAGFPHPAGHAMRIYREVSGFGFNSAWWLVPCSPGSAESPRAIG